MASAPISFSTPPSLLQKLQCGRTGFTIITINMIATAALAAVALLSRNNLKKMAALYSIIALPSLSLFGVRDYFRFLPAPLQLGIGNLISTCSTTIGSTGVWSGQGADWGHFYDPRLSRAMQALFKKEDIKTVLDLGCGKGDYVRDLLRTGLTPTGIDGNPETPSFVLPALGIVHDLTQPLDRTAEAVISLEVGEHIPKQHEAAFLDNLARCAQKFIVLSWAREGQPGLGHVNCQNNEYIQSQILFRGWSRALATEAVLRAHTSPLTFWFADTVMVYKRSLPDVD